MLRVEPCIEQLLGHLRLADPGGVLGAYLFGSSAVGGLRPQSDIDVLVVIGRSLSRLERRRLVDLLLKLSGRGATASPGRPLELTALVLDDVVPWTYPPICDFLFGEWMRDDVLNGRAPERHVNTDIAVLITTTRQHAICLLGPRPADLLEPVPLQDLHTCIRDSLAPLMSDLVGDERNVLLTLARMLVTLETGRVLPKNEAADLIAPSVPERQRSVLSLAARAYEGRAVDRWSDLRDEVQLTAYHLAERVRRTQR
jgi:predicted nucleotidyltransferase